MADNEPPEHVRKFAEDLKTVMQDDMEHRLQSLDPDVRGEAVDTLIRPGGHLPDLLKHLTPEERLQWIQRRIELLIHMTPTGMERAAMTEANIRLMVALEPVGAG